MSMLWYFFPYTSSDKLMKPKSQSQHVSQQLVSQPSSNEPLSVICGKPVIMGFFFFYVAINYSFYKWSLFLVRNEGIQSWILITKYHERWRVSLSQSYTTIPKAFNRCGIQPQDVGLPKVERRLFELWLSLLVSRTNCLRFLPLQRGQSLIMGSRK